MSGLNLAWPVVACKYMLQNFGFCTPCTNEYAKEKEDTTIFIKCHGELVMTTVHMYDWLFMIA